MTAYASRSRATGAGQLSWELRSVNQRFLDLSLRMPEEFRELDAQVRERLKNVLTRGKVEASLRFQADPSAAGFNLAINDGLARALIDCHGQLAGLAKNFREPDLVTLMQWPGLISEQRPDFEQERLEALELLDEALGGLIEAREQEGRAIAKMLASRLAGIDEQVARIRRHLPAVREALKSRFAERLAGLEQPLEPGRLEQEVVLQLHKLDVDEELDRLETHVAEMRRVLQLNEPVGRRLDFLSQELNREANTLASKATAAESAQAAVELKVLIEQLREQVQNVE